MLQVGDIVARKSYGCDIYFRVIEIRSDGKVLLAGIDYRIEVDASESDLERISLNKLLDFRKIFTNEVDQKVQKILKQRKSQEQKEAYRVAGSLLKKPGKVLHIDGDAEYLKLCLTYYKKLEIPAAGEMIAEDQQPAKIRQLLEKHTPDIVVITGHDSIRKDVEPKELSSYRSSKYFVEAVKEARRYEPSKDGLVIFAGACQSYYEALIDAGANFASSPERILIHALDPVLIVEKVAYTSLEKVLGIEEALHNSITGIEGLGGLQTRGTYRQGAPSSIYEVENKQDLNEK